MDFEQIKKYWEERASSDSTAQSTTQDYFMREIELRVMKNKIEKIRPTCVMDIGCGDARTTLRLASEFPMVFFNGGDYSKAMVNNAISNITESGLTNINVHLCDITRPLKINKFDLAYSTRCLINLPSWNLQQQAIKHIHDALAPKGHYVMIENFIEGQENFNQVRKAFNLPTIPIRNHNLFFKRQKLINFISSIFDIVDEVNISSSYYLVSRVIYSKICKEKHLQPDYFDEHHRYAACLPFSGEYGPVRMICMRRQ
jgi:ubiquinone/menaquinone biosynthesis C-methylase UbiE